MKDRDCISSYAQVTSVCRRALVFEPWDVLFPEKAGESHTEVYFYTEFALH